MAVGNVVKVRSCLVDNICSQVVYVSASTEGEEKRTYRERKSARLESKIP